MAPPKSAYEIHAGHVQAAHENCENPACFTCNLFICCICGGLEGSLLPQCPKRRLTPEEDQVNYQAYCTKTGPFAEIAQEKKDSQ